MGYNYRLSELHAALGISQLKKLDAFIEQRRELAGVYDRALASLPLKLPQKTKYAESAWHLYMIELTGHNRAAVFSQLQRKGVGVNVHYIPIHLQPYYKRLGFNKGDFPHAEAFYQNAITIPLFPSMTVDEQHRVIEALQEVLA